MIETTGMAMRRLLGLVVCVALWTPAPARADCSGGAKATGRSCSGISFQGCCDGEKLLFCEAGELCEKNCEASQHCGFSLSKGFYDCGTDGMPDPLQTFDMTCPSDPCGGVGYNGCCAGNTAVWCEQGTLKSLDCSLNVSKSTCGESATSQGAVDCVLPGGAAGRGCGGTAGGDIVVGDAVSPGDQTSQADIPIDFDALAVPDMNSPSECADLGRYWKVTTTNCPGFADSAQVKEERCVGVWAGLVPSAEWHPYGRVTLSGVQLSFMEAGLKHQCSAQFAGTDLQGQCFWGDSQCVFTLTPTEAPSTPAGNEIEGAKKGGGCATGLAASGQHGTLVLALLLLLSLVGRRRVR